jgi:hypothetical protein
MPSKRVRTLFYFKRYGGVKNVALKTQLKVNTRSRIFEIFLHQTDEYTF